MKSFLLLPLYTATVIAHVSSHSHDEISGFTSLLQLSIREPECPANFLDITSCNNSTQCNAQRSQIWSFSSPCIKSIQSEEEICVFTDSNFAQGRGISLITTVARAKFIASQPAFTNLDGIKLLPQTTPPSYMMTEIPGKGMGLEAIHDIKQGELIMADTPSLMVDSRSFKWLPAKERRLLQTAAVEHLPEAHQAAIMQLTAHVNTRGMPKDEIVGKITLVNSFDVIPDLLDPVRDEFFTLFPNISRFNHDCRPNAAYRFNHETMTHNVRALRDIESGEELTLTYTNPSLSRKDRQDRLKLWGFECTCDLCMQDKWHTTESDRRIAQINSLMPKFTQIPSPATPEMAETLIDLHKDEELWEAIWLPYTYAALQYSTNGDASMAEKYAQMAIRHGIPIVGDTHDYMIEMATLVESPLEHWSWRINVKEPFVVWT
ncbi:hypothetical protein BP6252_11196 [Coleophoma cylindrospora]|uniref:SET domain-containing protein n=1 Tax=Coleophoma cylindrospora TaxID=1849047 RepID=A0A3D8QPJ9_9HELO|nr:hypothetical protein BP6252_11196 [Coleophoma cylindrospora]